MIFATKLILTKNIHYANDKSIIVLGLFVLVGVGELLKFRIINN